MRNYFKINVEEIIFLEAYFVEKIWGGSYFNDFFKMKNEKNIGEAWLVSAIPNKSNIVLNDPTQSLYDLWKNKAYLFNFGINKYSYFPLLFKILAPLDNLSIQVHPDDEYAKKYNSFGKNECWYIYDFLDNEEKSIVLGHKMKNFMQLKDYIFHKEWNKLLNFQKIKKGDVIDIKPGTIHALLKNIVVFELQQASELTFRLFDYNRKDINGKFRQLHLKESLDVINYNNENSNTNNFLNIDENELTTMIKNKFFTFIKLKVNDHFSLNNFIEKKDFIICFVLDGFGFFNKIEIQEKDIFIIPYTAKNYNFQGKFTIFIAYST